MQQGSGNSGDNLIPLVIICLLFVGLLAWQWHRVLDISRSIDLLPISLYAKVLPGALGDFYKSLASQYANYPTPELTISHQAFAGRYAWYPLIIPVAIFIALKSFGIKKVRSMQQFRIMDRTLFETMYAERKPSAREREPWTVNRWFVFYKLRAMAWRSEEWTARVEKALLMQLGEPNPPAVLSDDELLEKANPLVLQFAEFLNELSVKRNKGKFKLDPAEARSMAVKALRLHEFPSGSILRLLAAGRERDGFISVNPFKGRLFDNASSIPIWWGLNSLGRQTVHIEALGVMSHFYREVSYQERLTEPDLQWAFEGLDRIREYRVKNILGDLTEQVEISPPAIRDTI